MIPLSDPARTSRVLRIGTTERTYLRGLRTNESPTCPACPSSVTIPRLSCLVPGREPWLSERAGRRAQRPALTAQRYPHPFRLTFTFQWMAQKMHHDRFILLSVSWSKVAVLKVPLWVTPSVIRPTPPSPHGSPARRGGNTAIRTVATLSTTCCFPAATLLGQPMTPALTQPPRGYLLKMAALA